MDGREGSEGSVTEGQKLSFNDQGRVAAPTLKLHCQNAEKLNKNKSELNSLPLAAVFTRNKRPCK